MRISAKAEYACLALIELARLGINGTPLRVRTIAEAQGIPERYLLQILLQLKAAGLVRSARGTVGGYHLVRRAEEITLAEAIAAIEGPGDATCRGGSTAARRLGEILCRAREAERTILAQATIAQLATPEGTLNWVV